MQRSIEHLFTSFLGQGDVDFTWFIEHLRTFVTAISENDLSFDFRIILSLRHLLFLLHDGLTVYADCQRQVTSSLCHVLVVERIYKNELGLCKLLAKLAIGKLPRDPAAFHEFLNGPSIVIYVNPIEIQIEPPELNFAPPVLDLTLDRFIEVYKNKQKVTDQIHRVRRSQSNLARLSIERLVKLDRRVNQLIVSKSSPDRLNQPRKYKRSKHPYRGPVLHILPRLIRPSGKRTALQMIRQQLPDIASFGFSGVLLAPIDKQSVHTYFNESPLGQLTAHFNNHGYWCSGEVGVDPALGNSEDYAELVASTASIGVSYMQDCTFGTLGYPAQIDWFASSSLQSPTTKLMVGDRTVDVWDADVFLPVPNIPAMKQVERLTSLQLYADALTQAHFGDLYALPRPNIYKHKVLRLILARSLNLVESFGVSAFRIDMSKHLGFLPLRKIIKKLRLAVLEKSKLLGTSLEFVALLEHRTESYRDIRFAMDGIGEQDANVYFYDFPLATVLQRIFIDNSSMSQAISGLLLERSKWNINLYQLIPTFIDHDEQFRPIYNGGQETSDIVVIGYAMTMMLSANGPSVYVGYEDARLGVSDLSNYYSYTEQFSRKMKDDIFTAGDSRSPASRIAILFKLFQDIGTMEHVCADRIAWHGADQWLEISRPSVDKETKSIRQLQAYFCKGNLKEETSSADREILFEHKGAYSVILSFAK